mmetsp:Transcript_32799/g.71605  ORF Transcript_32799/g.71605 Transcript_32799/m.71605 type:complete len:244 (+) Transcript_32799:57-788(+)
MGLAEDLRRLWLQSVLLSDTYIGREKSARVFQYAARMLYGITDWDLFGNLLRTLALSRKTLRFYKPVKAVKRILDLKRDQHIDKLDRDLTIAEVGSDAIYALIDHVTFVQRIGGMKWMSQHQADTLDRVLEVFWFTEIVPVIWRETRKLFNLRRRARELDAKALEDKPGTATPTSASIAAAAKQAKILLFKAVVCDLPCSFYFMLPVAFKNQRINRTWCGFLGVVASVISLQQNWPKDKVKEA